MYLLICCIVLLFTIFFTFTFLLLDTITSLLLFTHCFLNSNNNIKLVPNSSIQYIVQRASLCLIKPIVSNLNIHILILRIFSRIVSISTVFVNKTLLSDLNLNAPMFIAFYQTVMSALICHIMKILSKLYPSKVRFPESKPFDLETIKDVRDATE